MNRCTKCIIPEGYPKITFDAQGVCSLCRNHQPFKAPLGEERLREVLASEPRNGPYDCVVPLSGGKDSTYILYHAVKKLGLRVVAFYYDGRYQHPLAIENVQKACQSLNVPLETLTSPFGVRRRILRQTIKLSRKYGARFNTCANCEMIIRVNTIRVARKFNVPFVLYGSTVAESSMPAEQFYSGRRRNLFQRLMSLARKSMSPKKLITYLWMTPQLLAFHVYCGWQLWLLHAPFKYVLFPLSTMSFTEQNPRFIRFYDYVPWDVQASLKTLENELGWRHPPEKDMRFDCCLNALVDYDYIRKTNISHNGEIMCKLIREGTLTREQALEREERILQTAEPDCLHLIESLDLKNAKTPIW